MQGDFKDHLPCTHKGTKRKVPTIPHKRSALLVLKGRIVTTFFADKKRKEG